MSHALLIQLIYLWLPIIWLWGLAWHMTALRYLGACNTCFKLTGVTRPLKHLLLGWAPADQLLPLPVPPVRLQITISSPSPSSSYLTWLFVWSFMRQGETENQSLFLFNMSSLNLPDWRRYSFHFQPIWLSLVCRPACDVEPGPYIMVCGMSQRELVAAFLHSTGCSANCVSRWIWSEPAWPVNRAGLAI